MTDADVNRSLLFTVMAALQDDLIDRGRFAETWAAWTLKMDEPIPGLFARLGLITAEDCRAVDRKLELKLEEYRGDPRATPRRRRRCRDPRHHPDGGPPGAPVSPSTRCL